MTQDELKELFKYDCNTGLFTRLLSSNSNGLCNVGSIAGTADKNGYIRIRINKKPYYSHRLAWLYMTGSMPKDFIDHINGVRNDNRYCNLREATEQQNHFNRRKCSTNKSGFKGVHWKESQQRWIAQGSLNCKRKYLGSFLTAELAHEAYTNFSKENHGEFYLDGE